MNITEYSYTKFTSPLGKIYLSADDTKLTGLWFSGQKGFPAMVAETETNSPILNQVKYWLNIYFSGKEPNFTPLLNLKGTDFQKQVWKILLTIPYGNTITYGEIGKRIAKERGIASMSAQAVGNAVGHNPISIIVPCHRVIGSDGSLTGYAGGVEKKAALLKLEGVSIAETV